MKDKPFFLGTVTSVVFILRNILKVDTNVQKTSHFLCRYLYFFDVCLRKILRVDANVQKMSHSLCMYLSL